MRARSIRAVPVLVALLLPVLACKGGDSGGPSGPPEVDEVVVSAVGGGTDVQVQRGDSVQLQARALRDGAEVAGVTFQWRSEAPTVASVDGNGLVQGLEYGDADIVAELVGAVGPAGRVTASVVGPAVASITFSPESAWLDTGDTLTLRAIPRSSGGAQLTGVELTWRSTSGNATVDATGRVQGVTPGFAEIEAEAWNGVTGSARVRVTPVTGLEPDTGRYGAVMTIQGAGLPANISRVEFTAASGSEPVQAFVRSASATGIEVWVPAETGTGPIRLVGATDSFPTSRPFQITANDDIFEGGCGGQEPCAYIIPVPYQNPSLVSALGNEDIFEFQLEQPSPISVYLVDRGPKTRTATVDAFFIRAEPFGVPGYIVSVDFVQGAAHLDSVVYSHANLPAGRYQLNIAGISLTSQNFARRQYGVTITTTSSFQIAPDAFEPNDMPEDAAGTPVTLPFDRSDLAAENPYSLDNYVLTVPVASEITASVAGAAGNLELVLLRGDSVGAWEAATGDVVAISQAPGSNETVVGSVPAGSYTVAVVELGGQATTYSLQITATPASPDGPFTLGAGLPPASGARRFPFLAPLNPERIARVRAH